MSQALEKWYTKGGHVGQVVVQVNLHAQTTHNSAFAAAHLHRELNLLCGFFLPSSRRVWGGSVLMCKSSLLFLCSGKLPAFVPCGNHQHVFPRWPQSLQNSSQLWKDKGACVLASSRTCEHQQSPPKCSSNSVYATHQGCIFAPPKSASDVTCVDIPTCISPPQLFQFTNNFSVSFCTYSSSDVLSRLSTRTLSIEKRCWEWAHMVSHSAKTQHLWIGMDRFSY